MARYNYADWGNGACLFELLFSFLVYPAWVGELKERHQDQINILFFVYPPWVGELKERLWARKVFYFLFICLGSMS